MLMLVKEWCAVDTLIELKMRVDGQSARSAYVVCNRNATVDQLSLAAMDYLMMTGYPQNYPIEHSMTWVS